MKKKTLTKRNMLILLVAAAVLLTLGSSALASRQESPQDFTAIQVLYKLDPRLTGGGHIGERWVSPPVYDIASESVVYVIETKVEGISADGGITLIPANWVASNPALVTVVPAAGNIVELHIRGQGETVLEVTAGGHYKELFLSTAFLTDLCTNVRVKLAQGFMPSNPAETCRLLIPSIYR